MTERDRLMMRKNVILSLIADETSEKLRTELPDSGPEIPSLLLSLPLRTCDCFCAISKKKSNYDQLVAEDGMKVHLKLNLAEMRLYEPLSDSAIKTV
jgi:hypothetical protein